MRHFAHGTGDLKRGRAAALRLLTGIFLVLLWACAGCGGGGDEQAEPAAAGSRMVPQGAEQPAAQTADSTSAAEDAGETMEAPEEAPAGETVVTEPTTEPAAAATEPAPEKAAPANEAAPEPKTAPVSGNLQTGGEYSLQLGSFRTRANAEARAQVIRDTGYAPEISAVVVDGTTYHRVEIRNLADRSTAERVGRELKDLLGIDFLVKKSG